MFYQCILAVYMYTAKIEGLLLLLCGYLSFIFGILQVIIQLYRSSTKKISVLACMLHDC